MKIVAMIPARLGSQRIKKKNLRLIDGKPLINYIIKTVVDTHLFDEIYLNSEADIFEQIANENSIKFYKRPSELSSNTATNDEFAYNFMKNTDGDVLIQILPTSPLLTSEEIISFVKHMVEYNYDTLISVKHEQIACVYKDSALNFDRFKVNPPSQEMEPVKVYATALMGWKYDNFKKNIERFKSAYHGGDGKIGYFELRGLSTIDIDREEDFLLAEAIITAKNNGFNLEKRYYNEEQSMIHVENFVEDILKKDGVINNDLYDVNNEIISLSDIINSQDNSVSWSKRIIDTENNSMTIISQLPGEGNRLHFHPDWNEWWYIVDGEWEWEIEGVKKIVKKGDVVFISKGRKHKITAIGSKPAIRMAVSRADVDHVYPHEQG